MRKILYILTIVMLASCSGNKQDSSEQIESSDSTEIIDATQDVAEVESVITEPQEDDEETGYTPPFTVKFSAEGHLYGKRLFSYVIKLMKNGRVKGTYSTQEWNPYKEIWLDSTDEEEIEGKWSTIDIPFGDGYMKIYAIDISGRSETMYMPCDCDIIWMCDDAYYQCRDWNTKIAVKITEVIK